MAVGAHGQDVGGGGMIIRQLVTRRNLLAAPVGVMLGGTASGADAPREVQTRLTKSPGEALTVALTLDACPGGFDRRLAEGLAESGIAATIFVSGLWMRRNPGGLSFLLSRSDLFGLENHGMRHVPPVLGRRLFGLAGAATLGDVRREVLEGASAIEAATGRRPAWYRGATGYYSRSALSEIRSLGVSIAGYSLNGDMGASLSAGSVARRIGGARDGVVVVAHMNQPLRPSGRGALEGARSLLSRGARFVRLDQIGAAATYSQ
jgi:peptidoglycan/xylan/chitin deacetylase (PgdA/CDA1 family)